ncbi:MAG: M48 family metallopeptidase [Rhodocyclaceae bacterium]|nr:M48 family metallopeptidase [Rhodocyclaceae bacterium]
MKGNAHGLRSATQGLQRDLDGLAYRLIRSARKTVALQVGREGIVVRAPLRMPVAGIEAFVASHRDWIQRKLDARQQVSERTRQALVDGLRIQVLGQPVRIRLSGAGRGASWGVDEHGGAVLRLPGPAPERQLERALRARALAWFEGRVEEYCLRLDVRPPAVRLGSARTRWGSCSQRSGIRLHWKLVLLAVDLAEYVVAHEVAHLKEMNHSPRFWAWVETLCPAWRDLRARLRREGAQLPEFLPPQGGEP